MVRGNRAAFVVCRIAIDDQQLTRRRHFAITTEVRQANHPYLTKKSCSGTQYAFPYWA